MRDWPEPDQDTTLDILETWDIGDYEEALAERSYDKMVEEEIARSEEAKANAQYDDDPYADWESPNTCACCATEYCQCMTDEELRHYEYEAYNEEQWSKLIGKALEVFNVAALNADAANARVDLLQAETNIARIKADIALFKRQLAYNGYVYIVSGEDPANDKDVENQLVNAEANLVEAKTVLADVRRREAARTAVVEAYNYVKYAEAKVEIKKDAKNRSIEFVNALFPDDEEDATVEHIEFVNALIELAEAKDALDLAKTLLTKTSLERTMDTIKALNGDIFW